MCGLEFDGNGRDEDARQVTGQGRVIIKQKEQLERGP